MIGSVFVRHEPGTVPLYLSSDGKNHRLTLEPAPNGDGTIIGYVYEKKSDDLNCIYEISDGKKLCLYHGRKGYLRKQRHMEANRPLFLYKEGISISHTIGTASNPITYNIRSL